ncbi:TPA: hypothetical protein RQK07_003180 [Vibrio vulnificus]|uniref:Uncharacterized protein n=2 Tax=Vibrio vulnificus TaxID=672 RepID=A0A3Q0L166_VIBVU|nr:hypothetical protein [Vibrio vulnificus]AAO08620.1 hypothetical protein VV1_0080 [Vibrio vulnificus CMCP6]EGR0392315.1 hypothetical protein [Vibrio vulnificus]EKZ9178793.1 hypothetical protein [Vibrio vulnificus]ELM6649457.1 hypothetical protein [Vibrio vulnificus]KFK53264.1 hypothetical protein JS86_21150 [Vibrio vulnificus]
MANLKNPNADLVATRDLDLRRRVERLATLDERKPAQMTRILLKKAVAEKEEELGLPPLKEAM